MLSPNGSNGTSHPFIQVPAHLQKRERSHDDLSLLIYEPSSEFSTVFFIRFAATRTRQLIVCQRDVRMLDA